MPAFISYDAKNADQGKRKSCVSTKTVWENRFGEQECFEEKKKRKENNNNNYYAINQVLSFWKRERERKGERERGRNATYIKKSADISTESAIDNKFDRIFAV